MSALPPRPCTTPGCGRLQPCAEHRRADDRRRGTTSERGYDGAHRRLRRAVLAEFPICQLRLVCDGAVATDLDHIVPIVERPDLRLVRSNVQSSCGPCNVVKAQKKAGKTAEILEKSSFFVAL